VLKVQNGGVVVVLWDSAELLPFIWRVQSLLLSCWGFCSMTMDS